MPLSLPPTPRQRRSFDDAATFMRTRTVENANRILVELLRPGMAVLDVGCANGSITADIARLVSPDGYAVGVDSNVSLILDAAEEHNHVSNVSFVPGDIYVLPFNEQFDLVSVARTLQWCRHPGHALAQCIQSVKPGGTVVALDYDHAKVQWSPPIPKVFGSFYKAYLRWRIDSGFNPSMATKLPRLMEEHGLLDVTVSPQHETYVRGKPGFEENLQLWRIVLDKRGDHLVQSGYLRAKVFREAAESYERWATHVAESITMYAIAAIGTRPPASAD